MPYIHVRTTASCNEEKEQTLKKELGKAITLLPGKTEDWLMVDIEGDCHLYFAGEKRPLSMVEVEVFGKSTAEAYSALTEKICGLMQKIFGIPGDGVYVKYAEKKYWGFDGENF